MGELTSGPGEPLHRSIYDIIIYSVVFVFVCYCVSMLFLDKLPPNSRIMENHLGSSQKYFVANVLRRAPSLKF